MQIFDTLVLLMAAGLLLALMFRRGTPPRWLVALAFLIGLGLLAHLIVEGTRWQMVPAYLVVAAALTLVLVRARRQISANNKSLLARIRVWSIFALASILLSLSALLSYAFPMFELAQPSGSYAIGTTQWHLVDENRDESYTEDAADKRELMARIWYPAESIAENTRANYWNHADIRSAAVTSRTPLPWFTFTHLGNLRSNSYWDAPIATTQPSFPIVLYSHGTGIGWESANTNLAEELASNGYVVIGINHTYIGSAAIFPDGRVIEHHAPTAAAMSEPPPEEIRNLQSKLESSKDWQEHIELYQQAMAIMPTAALEAVGRALDTQVADQISVLDQIALKQTKSEGSLADHMNLDRVGIVGMSLGGSAAFETCAKEPRCTAGVNLDGFHPRQIGLAPSNAAFLYINREENLLYQTNFQRSNAPAYSVIIPDATHFNFFDFTIMSPLYKRLGMLGPIDGYRMLDITGASVLSFFDIHLKDQTTPSWKSRLAEFEEISLDQRNDT